MPTLFSKRIGSAFLLVAVVLAAAPAVFAQTDAQRVMVVLRDGKIDIPEIIPDKWVVFVVYNAGKNDHGMVMEGQSMIRRIVGRLSPRSSTRVLVRLWPGSYRVYCPIGDHARNGEITQVLVVKRGTG